MGDYAGASEVLRTANASKAQRTAWSNASWQKFVQGQLAGSALPQVDAPADFVPVFVIGLPRTGTTLVTSLLAKDPRLRDRGELNWIDGMYQLLAEQGRLHDVRAISRVSEIVSAQMRQDDAPASWYLDKNPLNFRHLNLIAAIFPKAKIIHCRRDRRDTALSLWMQHFAHSDLNFSYEFSRIAAFESGYQSLIRHWRNTLPLDFLDVDYESLVTDTLRSVDRVHEFLGMLSPEMPVEYAPSSAITTASVWQVRQPVYTSSIGRWKNYEAHLPQLRRLF
ncbi:MAG TPA: sulfotransferase [Rhodanobacteraceae bacterium]|nr:sulfotransferase [Rhodanobacteraceae bacterium]